MVSVVVVVVVVDLMNSDSDDDTPEDSAVAGAVTVTVLVMVDASPLGYQSCQSDSQSCDSAGPGDTVSVTLDSSGGTGDAALPKWPATIGSAKLVSTRKLCDRIVMLTEQISD